MRAGRRLCSSQVLEAGEKHEHIYSARNPVRKFSASEEAMVALMHILGALALALGAGVVIGGVLLSRIINWWALVPLGAILLAAGAWLVSR